MVRALQTKIAPHLAARRARVAEEHATTRALTGTSRGTHRLISAKGGRAPPTLTVLSARA